MKLLGWMHRKFRQNSAQPLKDFVIGHPYSSSDDQQYFPRTTSMNKPFKQTHDHESQVQVNSANINNNNNNNNNNISDDDDQIFPGFLAIGTLGTSNNNNNNNNSDPSTPKFSISIDYITQTHHHHHHHQLTRNDLNLINHELEKLLLDNKSKDHHDDVPERNSIGNADGDVVVCPLQGYLFGSAVELSETTTTAVGKKESRISLGELFQKSKLVEGGGGGRCDQKVEEGGHHHLHHHHKYGIQFIKKKVKKKMMMKLGVAADSNTSLDHVSTQQTKFHKILHLFNRSKVYPESSTMMKEKLDQKAQKKKTNIIDIHGANYYKNNNNGDRTSIDEDNMIFPKNYSNDWNKLGAMDIKTHEDYK